MPLSSSTGKTGVREAYSEPATTKTVAEKTLSGNRQLKTEVTAVKELAERKLSTQVLVQVLNTKVRCVWDKGLPGPSPNYATKETQVKQQ